MQVDFRKARFILPIMILFMISFGLAHAANANVLTYMQNATTNPAYSFPFTNACTNNWQDGICTGNVVYTISTTLMNNLYVIGNVTINAGITLTTNGFSVLVSNQLIIKATGIEYGGNILNGGLQNQNGNSLTLSYGGSGGGSGVGLGGNTLANGGLNGGNGGTPSAPVVTQSNVIYWFENGMYKYLGGAGGAGSSVTSGASGAFGIYDQACNVLNQGTILTSGSTTGAGSETGGGGAGTIIIAYGNTGSCGYVGGTQTAIGGAGTNTGGNGGNGNKIAQTYGSNPYLPLPLINSYYPYQLYTNDINPSNTYSLYQTLNGVTSLLESNIVNINYIPPPNQISALYTYNVFQFNGTLGAVNTININATIDMIEITNPITFNGALTNIQYYPNLANLSKGSFNVLPNSWKLWSYPASSQALNYGVNTIQGSVFSSNQITFPVNILLSYNAPFGSFNVSLVNNPNIQTTLTQSALAYFSSNTGVNNHREVLNLSMYDQGALSPISTNTIGLLSTIINNYTVSNAYSFNFLTTNTFNVSINVNNFVNPPITISSLALASTAGSYLPTAYNTCPTTNSYPNFQNTKEYLVSAATGSQYTVSASSGFTTGGAGDFLQVIKGLSVGSGLLVQQIALPTSTFQIPLIVGQPYGFQVVNSHCQVIFTTNFTVWTSPIVISIPINSTVPQVKLPNLVYSCSLTYNSILANDVLTCNAADTNDQVTNWVLKFFNESNTGIPGLFQAFFTGNSFTYTNSTFSNSIAYQAAISYQAPNASGTRIINFPIQFKSGFNTGVNGLLVFIILIICVGFGVALAQSPGGAQHGMSNTMFILGFGVFACFMLGFTTDLGVLINGGIILFIIFIGMLIHTMEGSTFGTGY